MARSSNTPFLHSARSSSTPLPPLPPPPRSSLLLFPPLHPFLPLLISFLLILCVSPAHTGSAEGTPEWHRTFRPLRLLYISPSPPDGVADGSRDRPFALFDVLDNDSDIPLPGDLFYLMAGVYDARDIVSFRTQGTAANPIVFRAEPGVRSRVTFKMGVFIYSKYTWLWGIEITDIPASVPGPCTVQCYQESSFYDETNLLPDGDFDMSLRTSYGNRLINNWIHHTSKSGICSHFFESTHLHGNVVHDIGGHGLSLGNDNTLNESFYKYVTNNVVMDVEEGSDNYIMLAHQGTPFEEESNALWIEGNVFSSGRWKVGSQSDISQLHFIKGNQMANVKIHFGTLATQFRFAENYITHSSFDVVQIYGDGGDMAPQEPTEFVNNTVLLFGDYPDHTSPLSPNLQINVATIVGGEHVANVSTSFLPDTAFENNTYSHDVSFGIFGGGHDVKDKDLGAAKVSGFLAGLVDFEDFSEVVSAPVDSVSVSVLPNIYEGNRFIVAIHNFFTGETTQDVALDLPFLSPGEVFEIHPYSSPFSEAIFTGTYEANFHVSVELKRLIEVFVVTVSPPASLDCVGISCDFLDVGCTDGFDHCVTTVTCDSPLSCLHLKFTCTKGSSCVIRCLGEFSCFGIEVTLKESSAVTIECAGDRTCLYMTKDYASPSFPQQFCTGYHSCLSPDYSTPPSTSACDPVRPECAPGVISWTPNPVGYLEHVNDMRSRLLAIFLDENIPVTNIAFTPRGDIDLVVRLSFSTPSASVFAEALERLWNGRDFSSLTISRPNPRILSLSAGTVSTAFWGLMCEEVWVTRGTFSLVEWHGEVMNMETELSNSTCTTDEECGPFAEEMMRKVADMMDLPIDACGVTGTATVLQSSGDDVTVRLDIGIASNKFACPPPAPLFGSCCRDGSWISSGQKEVILPDIVVTPTSSILLEGTLLVGSELGIIDGNFSVTDTLSIGSPGPSSESVPSIHILETSPLVVPPRGVSIVDVDVSSVVVVHDIEVFAEGFLQVDGDLTIRALNSSMSQPNQLVLHEGSTLSLSPSSSLVIYGCPTLAGTLMLRNLSVSELKSQGSISLMSVDISCSLSSTFDSISIDGGGGGVGSSDDDECFELEYVRTSSLATLLLVSCSSSSSSDASVDLVIILVPVVCGVLVLILILTVLLHKPLRHKIFSFRGKESYSPTYSSGSDPQGDENRYL